MKKSVFVLVILFSATIKTWSQSGQENMRGKNNAVSFGFNIPFGEFSQTHIAGIGLGYSWSHHRFGKLNVLPKKLIGFIANGGIDYYLGIKETVAGYDYRYDSYINLYGFGGIIYNPCKNGNIFITAGPLTGIYKGNDNVGFGVKLNGSYYITDNICLYPGFFYMKHREANALWFGIIQAAYTF